MFDLGVRALVDEVWRAVMGVCVLLLVAVLVAALVALAVWVAHRFTGRRGRDDGDLPPPPAGG